MKLGFIENDKVYGWKTTHLCWKKSDLMPKLTFILFKEILLCTFFVKTSQFKFLIHTHTEKGHPITSSKVLSSFPFSKFDKGFNRTPPTPAERSMGSTLWTLKHPCRSVTFTKVAGLASHQENFTETINKLQLHQTFMCLPFRASCLIRPRSVSSSSFTHTLNSLFLSRVS